MDVLLKDYFGQADFGLDAVLVSRLRKEISLSIATAFLALLTSASIFIIQIHFRGASASQATKVSKRRPMTRAATDDTLKKSSTTAAAAITITDSTEAAARRALKKPPRQFVDLMNFSMTKIMENIGETSWKPVHKELAVEVFSIPDLNSLPDRYKASTIIKAPAETIFKCLYDMKQRSKWDKGMVGHNNRVVASYDQSYSITYYQTAGVLGVSSRDFLDLRRLMKLEDNKGFLIVAHSVEHPDQPVVPGVIRAHNYPNGQLIKRREDGTSELVYFIQVDLKGWMAKSLIRLALGGSLARILSDLRDYAEKLPVPLPSHEIDSEPGTPSSPMTPTVPSSSVASSTSGTSVLGAAVSNSVATAGQEKPAITKST